MADTETFVISSCRELSTGDEIEARYKGILVHRGRVSDIAQNQGLFWIADNLTGTRRLLDLDEFEVNRVRPEAAP